MKIIFDEPYNHGTLLWMLDMMKRNRFTVTAIVTTFPSHPSMAVEITGTHEGILEQAEQMNKTLQRFDPKPVSRDKAAFAIKVPRED